jgi:hypothetical protein
LAPPVHTAAAVLFTAFAYLLLGETLGTTGCLGIGLVLTANVLRQVPNPAHPPCSAMLRRTRRTPRYAWLMVAPERSSLPIDGLSRQMMRQVPWESCAPTRELVTPRETPQPGEGLLRQWGLKGGGGGGGPSTAGADSKAQPLLGGAS